MPRKLVTEIRQLLEEYVRLHPENTSEIVTATLIGQTDRSLNEVHTMIVDDLNDKTSDTNLNTPSTRYHLKQMKDLCEYLSEVPANSSQLRKYHAEYTPDDPGSETRIIGTGMFTAYQLADDEYAIIYSKRMKNTTQQTTRELDVAFTTDPDQFFDLTLAPDNWYRKVDLASTGG